VLTKAKRLTKFLWACPAEPVASSTERRIAAGEQS
jgi:hypothetical protein